MITVYQVIESIDTCPAKASMSGFQDVIHTVANDIDWDWGSLRWLYLAHTQPRKANVNVEDTQDNSLRAWNSAYQVWLHRSSRQLGHWHYDVGTGRFLHPDSWVHASEQCCVSGDHILSRTPEGLALKLSIRLDKDRTQHAIRALLKRMSQMDDEPETDPHYLAVNNIYNAVIDGE